MAAKRKSASLQHYFIMLRVRGLYYFGVNASTCCGCASKSFFSSIIQSLKSIPENLGMVIQVITKKYQSSILTRNNNPKDISELFFK